jgi:hypothetical protein
MSLAVGETYGTNYLIGNHIVAREEYSWELEKGLSLRERA